MSHLLPHTKALTHAHTQTCVHSYILHCGQYCIRVMSLPFSISGAPHKSNKGELEWPVVPKGSIVPVFNVLR